MRHSTISVLAGFLAITLATAGGAAAQVQVPAADAPRTIHVNAEAAVQRAPDRATVHLAVETLAETARDATAENAAAMDNVLAALRQLGIPDERIRTLRLELHPRYDHRRPAEEPLLVGYQALNQVQVRLDDTGQVGRVVDAAVQAGANRVTGIQFELSDPAAAYHDALRLAVERARAEAAVLAEALGEPLGPALQVSTGGGPRPVFARMEAARMDVAAAPTPVEPGELDIQAHVSIVYRIGS